MEVDCGSTDGQRVSHTLTLPSPDDVIPKPIQLDDSPKQEGDADVSKLPWLKALFWKPILRALPPSLARKFGKNFDQVSDDKKPTKASSKKNAGDENEERGNWSNHLEFLLSCIGFAVGLGNIWRFPYVCYRNGGGAFLVIYWMLSALVGFPIMLAEQCIGQYTSQGSLHCWQYAPIVSGVGFSVVAVSFLIAVYYDIIIVWATFYLFASFTSQLPWEKCDYSDWADYRCEMQKVDCLAGAEHIRGLDGLCYNATEFGFKAQQRKLDGAAYLPLESLSSIERNVSTVLGFWNETLATEWKVNSVMATDQYYHNYVLRDSDPSVGYNNFGRPFWILALIFLFTWIILFFTLLNGIKTSGKIVYVTSIAPYAVLFVLIIRGATLPGAYEGIMYFLTPDFDRLKSPEVWYAAAGQLVYSLSVCQGGIITLASYNRFNNNIIRDALIVVFADSFTSFIASFAIFSVIGYGAFLLERPVDKVADVGAGLAFIVYPKVLSQLPGAVFFSIIFFIMLMCVGLSTMVNTVETMYTAALDFFPVLRRSGLTKRGTLSAICGLCFLLGIPFICPGGPKLLQVFDDYAATWAVFLVGILEVTSLCWIYGFRHFTKDLRLMMSWIPERPAQIAMVALWGFITPGVLTFIMICVWVEYVPRSDPIEESIGWFLTWFVAIWMPAAAIWVIATGKGTFFQRLVAAFSPTEKWGPYLEQFRSQAKYLEEFRPMNDSKPGQEKAWYTNYTYADYDGMICRPPSENYTVRKRNSADSGNCKSSLETIEMSPSSSFPVNGRSQPVTSSQPVISDNFRF